jgi:hypothetical protein
MGSTQPFSGCVIDNSCSVGSSYTSHPQVQ